ncbi:MAG: M23 family metallopeptidase [Cryomorphaceae bacterium]|nr:MAG: M23 family metallopeptidase [Cryomorphaceae bacterium]
MFKIPFSHLAVMTALLFGAFFWSVPASAQPAHWPVDYFSAPLDIPLFLSGNFAELRSNHFHSGIDIKTQGVEGMNVVAAAEGYVSRIRISPYGYGNALYIDHPNGYTTVYAHLKTLSPKLALLARVEQYSLESFELDLKLEPHQAPVERGEVIAKSGNTGGSGGPHLHFEIRETTSQLSLNPLLFNFAIKDDIPPIVRGLRVYPMSDSSTVEGRRDDMSYVVAGSNGKYTLKNQQVVRVFGPASFAVHTYDLLNEFPNKCGIHRIRLYQEDELIFESQLDSINFNTFRQINTYKDFRLFHLKKWHYHRSYVSPYNDLTVYKTAVNNGVVHLPHGRHSFQYVVNDSYGNESTLQFQVEWLTQAPATVPTVGKKVKDVFHHDRENVFETDNLALTIPPQRLYEDTDFTYAEGAKLWNSLGPVHHIHDGMVPVDKWFTLRMKIDDIPEELEEKVLVTAVTGGQYHKAKGGRYKDGWVTTRLREFGSFTARIDTVPPRIKPMNIFNGKNMAGVPRIDLSITDDLSGIKHFEARIDGEWILMEYEPKASRITHHLEKGRFKGTRELVVKVTDERNNVATYKASLNF